MKVPWPGGLIRAFIRAASMPGTIAAVSPLTKHKPNSAPRKYCAYILFLKRKD